MPFAPGTVSSSVFFGGGGVAPAGAGATSALQIYNAKTYGVPNDGSNGGAAVNALVANVIGASKATMYFPPGQYGIDLDIDLPATIDVWVAKGATFIAKNAGRTLRIRGRFDAPDDLVFDYSVNAYTVILGSVRVFLPNWWGAAPDGATNSSPGLTRCIAASTAYTVVPGLTPRNRIFFNSGVWRFLSTVLIDPHIEYVGVRAQTVDITANFLYPNSNGSILRADPLLYTNTPAGQGVLFYVPGGATTWRKLQFVGTAGINGNPSVAHQWASSGGVANTGRPHETDGTGGTGGNSSGHSIEDCTYWGFVRAWECCNLNDTYAHKCRFESCTTNIYLYQNAQPGRAYGNDFELCDTEQFAHSVGISASTGLGTMQPHRVRLVGGMMESFTIANSVHVAYTPAVAPRQVWLEFVGVKFQHDIGNAVDPTSIAAGTRHFLINGNTDAQTIATTSLTRAANVVTVVTAARHPWQAGQRVTIAGATDGTFNGVVIVTSVTDETHFTYAQVAANAATVAGTSTSFESALRIRVTGGCTFLGSSCFFGRSAGASLKMNTDFSDSFFRNVTFSLNIAAFIRWNACSFSNSLIQSVIGQDCDINGCTIADVGTFLDLSDAGANQPRWRLKDNNFDGVTTPYTILNAATNNDYDISGNRGSGVVNNRRGVAVLAAGIKVVVLAQQEPDAAYRVLVTADRNETFYITAKTVAQFQINSSNAASVGNADWQLIR